MPGLVRNTASYSPSNAINKAEKRVSEKRVRRAEKGFTLSISNEDMDDINRITKSLEDSGVLTDGVTETVRHEVGFHGSISAPMLMEGQEKDSLCSFQMKIWMVLIEL